jgi:hypothetical protein
MSFLHGIFGAQKQRPPLEVQFLLDPQQAPRIDHPTLTIHTDETSSVDTDESISENNKTPESIETSESTEASESTETSEITETLAGIIGDMTNPVKSEPGREERQKPETVGNTQGFESRELVRLFEIIDKLRECGVSEDISLPQVSAPP